jgi:plasmid stabilization system protein ParE
MVDWTDTALDHLRAIHAYVARNSPQYALRVVDRLTRRSQQIAVFPCQGAKSRNLLSHKFGRFWKGLSESSITLSATRYVLLPVSIAPRGGC